jgi:UDP-N-acetyl-D-mannosaminuronate dehydrogenase
LQSVELNFDSKALNEVSFRRDHQLVVDRDEFLASHARIEGHALTAEAEGDVHDEVEQEALRQLEAQVHSILDGLAEGDVVLVESEQGGTYPKTRQTTRNVIREGENRLHFRVHIDPPLALGVYRSSA